MLSDFTTFCKGEGNSAYSVCLMGIEGAQDTYNCEAEV